MKTLSSAIILCLLLAGCREYKRATPNQRTLVDEWQSFSRPEEVKAKLESRQIAFEESFEGSLGANDRRPRFDFRRLQVPEYTLFGVKGELRFEFFNDRLMEVRFRPATSELGQFLNSVASVEKVDTLSVGHRNQRREYRLPRGVQLSASIPFDQKFTLTWTEPALEQEMLDWIAKYS
jgi:hypothetical protein